jgi:hypothetical protein
VSKPEAGRYAPPKRTLIRLGMAGFAAATIQRVPGSPCPAPLDRYDVVVFSRYCPPDQPTQMLGFIDKQVRGAMEDPGFQGPPGAMEPIRTGVALNASTGATGNTSTPADLYRPLNEWRAGLT